MTSRWGPWIAAAVAVAVYAISVANGFAGDDPLVIERNARVHSIGEALAAWFKPYWPPPWEGAGLYRPFTMLTYGVEWTLAGGRPWLFHLDNVLLHGAVSGLVVVLARRWLPALGALVAGLVFAVHPVHVEAVANAVGRAELLAAVCLVGALLAARRYRTADSETDAYRWMGVTLLLVAVGLLSKEVAVIAVAAIAVDHALDPVPARRTSWSLYLAVGAVTLAWFHVWSAVAGKHVAGGATSAFYGLSRWEQITTMMPVQLDVLRLLAWPVDLSADYSPQTIPLRDSWTTLATLGLVAAGATVALGLALGRRNPGIAFGILIAAGSYAPTSNLLFTSGVVLAERALYLAVLAPACVIGWAIAAAAEQPYRRLATGAVALAVVALAGRSVIRIPFWKTALTPIVEDAADHGENYRARLHLGDLFAARHDTARALAEYLASAALAENDPFTAEFIIRSAVALGRPRQAVSEARRVYQLAPQDPRTGGWLVESHVAAGQLDSAVIIAKENAARLAGNVGAAGTLVWALRRAGAPEWKRQLAQVRQEWLAIRLVDAAARLDSVAAQLPTAMAAADFCDYWTLSGDAIGGMRPDLMTVVSRCRNRNNPNPGGEGSG